MLFAQKFKIAMQVLHKKAVLKLSDVLAKRNTNPPQIRFDGVLKIAMQVFLKKAVLKLSDVLAKKNTNPPQIRFDGVLMVVA